MSLTATGSPAGSPSRIATSPGPWDSPAVRYLNLPIRRLSHRRLPADPAGRLAAEDVDAPRRPLGTLPFQTLRSAARGTPRHGVPPAPRAFRKQRGLPFS